MIEIKRGQYASGLRKLLGTEVDYELEDMSEIFDKVYTEGVWAPKGPQDFGQPQEYMLDRSRAWAKMLSDIMRNKRVTSVVDFGCGPFNVYKKVVWPIGIDYTGYDVTEIPLKTARKNAPIGNFKFEVCEDFTQIKPADLLIVKEVFQHWPDRHVRTFFEANMDKYKIIAVVGATNNSISSEYFPFTQSFSLGSGCAAYIKS